MVVLDGGEEKYRQEVGEMEDMKYYIGIDAGGTFTDGVIMDEMGNLRIAKTPSVVEDPARGFMDNLHAIAQQVNIPVQTLLRKVSKLSYGTTIATNAIIEGKGATTGLIMTKGFRDTLPLARIGREYLGIDLQVERPPSPIPRNFIEEVSERIDHSGKVITPLCMEDVEAGVERLLAKGVQSIAVCLLWSFKNQSHERAIAEFIAKRDPNVYVCLSSELIPLIGEYERTASTVLNSRLSPLISAYLESLGRRLKELGFKLPLLIMQAIGGLIPAEDAAKKTITLINSGPTGGLIAGKYFSELLGEPDLLCADMGGTSFDVSLITNGRYSHSLITRVSGQNIFAPMLDVHTIGAGGGSIAWIDAGRRLKVGPQSAGAEPGPVCYGKGGTEPTITDADLALGRINPEYFLGGKMLLDKRAAEQAIEEKIAKPMGFSVVEAAWAITEIANANMSDAVRVCTIQKGYDPRDYIMIAFGGAGPTHAAFIAKEIGIKRVIVTPMATAQSAFGIATSDIIHSFSLTDITHLDDVQRINKDYQDLEQKAYALAKAEDIDELQIEVARFADMRYKGQSHEVTIPVPLKELNKSDMAQLINDFERTYEEIYGKGTTFREAGIEAVTFRVDLLAKTAKPALKQDTFQVRDVSQASKGKREVFFENDGPVVTSIYDGDALMAGSRISGPAVIEYAGTTVLVLSGQIAEVDAYRNIIIQLGNSTSY